MAGGITVVKVGGGKERRHHHLHITRDSVLFAAGLAGVTNETFFSRTERPFLLALFGTMLGLPVVLRLDGKDGKEAKPDDDDYGTS